MIHEPLFVSADFSASQNSLANLHLESFCDKFKLYGNPTQCNTIQRIKGQFWNFNLQLSYPNYNYGVVTGGPVFQNYSPTDSKGQ